MIILNKYLKAFVSVLLMTFCLFADRSFSQSEGENLDNQLMSLLKHDALSVSGLIQANGRYSFEDNQFNGGRTFQIGNARLSFSGALDQNFDYRFQFNIAREPNLLDAFIGYTHSEQFRIRAGVQKPQFGGDLLPHPGRTDFIGRARLVGALLKAREIGISFFGDIDRFRYDLAIYNGTGITANTDNQFLYMARFSYRPDIGDGRSLRIGINGAFSESFNTTSGSTGIQLEGDRFIYGGDVRYEDNTWIFAAEMLAGDLEVVNYIGGPEEYIVGYYLTGGYKISDRTRILARWDHLGFRERDRSSDQFILGLTHYMTDLISIKINLISEFDEAVDNQMGLSTSLQLHF